MASFPRLPPSGITVIVVGAGFAGLGAAIECDRKGHRVILLEKSSSIEELQRIGDIISFDPNASRLLKRWPGVWEALWPVTRHAEVFDMHAWTGELLTQQSFAWENKNWGPRLSGHRGEMHAAVYEHARARGTIDIRLGSRVTGYFETDKDAGVIIKGADGEEQQLVADAVLAAEGVRSPGRKIVLGFDDQPKSSGYAVYRAWFPAERLRDNELTRHLVSNGDWMGGWVGPDLHFLCSCLKDGRDFNWAYTHRDLADIDESWQFPGTVDEALANLDGWSPVVREIVKATPDGRLIDHKLVYRDTLPTFTSPKAHIALIGDAAHPFLPTSIQGAGQALEDGVTLAITLERCGKDNVSQAVRAYEKIRYDRVRKAQAQGVRTRERWHKANWDEVRNDPTRLHLLREAWLLDFDAEEHAYEVFDEVIQSLSRE
jgi:2-polyprenyl-6-methoxyphenol hydroxylase-like FAD-dependent oxidoreductase